MAAPVIRLEVILKLPASHGALLVLAKWIYQSMLGNAHFPSPSPTLAALLLVIEAYDAAITGRGASVGSMRRDARGALIAVLKHLRDYVQGIAETAVNDAVLVVESAGMRVRRRRARGNKPAFAIKQGSVSGLVLLIAKAVADQAIYYWQMSSDQKVWTSLSDTMTARTTVSGLTPGQTYYFRFRWLTRAGGSDYGQILSFMVK